MTDVIDRLAAVRPGGRADELRRHRVATRDNAQASYDALFTTIDERSASLAERAAIATFVAALHADEVATAHYGALLRETGDGAADGAHGPEALADAVIALADQASATGPYGVYPADGPLADESVDGLRFIVPETSADLLGERLAAALEHAHLLVFRPREASGLALAALAEAGWTTDGIVTLSQLVSFLAFQLRVVAGLRLLTAEEAA